MSLTQKQVYSKINLLRQNLNILLADSNSQNEDILKISKAIDELILLWYSKSQKK